MTPDEWTKLCAGDPSAWEAFVDRYLPLLYSAVRRTLPHFSSEDWDDVAQNIFVRLCQYDYKLLRSYSSTHASFTTWLTVVSRGAAIDFARRKKRRLNPQPLDDAPDVVATEAKSNDPIVLPAGLLSAREAAVLTLLFDHGLSVEETADRLGVASQTVRSTKHNALTKLRQYHQEPPA